MAQTIIFDNVDTNGTDSFVSAIGSVLLFADSTIVEAPEADGPNRIKVTSRFAPGDGATVTLLADDAETEYQFEQSVGKFVEGNLISGFAPLTEIKSDVRNYIFYPTVAIQQRVSLLVFVILRNLKTTRLHSLLIAVQS